MKNIIVLGATGSIGDSVLSVIKQNKDKLNLVGITFHKNTSKAAAIIDDFNIKNVYTVSKDSYNNLRHLYKNNQQLNFINDKSELEDLLNNKEVDFIVSAISGFAGLESTLVAAKTGKTILLANKESIVVAGDILLPLAKKYNTEIIPIDSEHNAIFQCLDSDKNTTDVSKVIITASGGPFLNKKVSELSQVTKKEALIQLRL
jgi:1-deoxy-D-xylulose-5-phosphate reductoisomerase